MIDLPAYSGPRAGCPKCRTGRLTTNYHYGSRATKETPHGEGWPCSWFDTEDCGLEHLCRYCRTCGYTRPEALPDGSGDDGAGTAGPGPFFPGTDLDVEAGRLFTLARWCRDSARAELGAGGWGDGQKAAFTRSFEDLVDNWTTYKCVLAFLPGADGEDGRPTREQVLADLEKPRRAFASALGVYHALLLEAAGHAGGPRPPDPFAGEGRHGDQRLSGVPGRGDPEPAPSTLPVPCEVTAGGDGSCRVTLGAFSTSAFSPGGWPALAKAKAVLGATIAKAVTRIHGKRPAFARDPAGALIVAYPELVCGSSLWRVTARGAVHLGYELMPPPPQHSPPEPSCRATSRRYPTAAAPAPGRARGERPARLRPGPGPRVGARAHRLDRPRPPSLP